VLALYQGQGDPHSRIQVAQQAVVLTFEASLHCFMDSKLVSGALAGDTPAWLAFSDFRTG
jgi:hypothetical protein